MVCTCSNISLRVIKSSTRFGNNPRLILVDVFEQAMLVPDRIRDCCCFVYCDLPTEGRKLIGTGFFIVEEILIGRDSPPLGLYYVVTAKHILHDAKKYALKEFGISNLPTGIRVNTFKGESTDIDIPDGLWLHHPNDASVDVAISPIVMPNSWKGTMLRTSHALSAEIINKEGIGIGDEVFLIGLFQKHPGVRKNLPIIRVGNVAMMPEEPIETDNGLIDAYLIECRSLSGLSGSPVFVVFRNPKHNRESTFYWMGLMYGHWNVDNTSDSTIGQNSEPLNTGIGIVVPAYKILEVMNQEKLIAWKKAQQKEAKFLAFPTPDKSLLG